MFNRNSIAIALVASFMIVANAKLLIKNSTDVKPSIEKITGGPKISIDTVPYQVFVEGEATCGGSIISPSHILTAGHCVLFDRYAPESVVVRSGSANAQSGGVLTSVSKIIVHEKYISDLGMGLDNDIALLVLKTPLEYNANTQKIDLLTRSPSPGEEGYISGWGATDSSNYLSVYLRGATVQVTDRSTCNRYLWNIKGTFCAIAFQGYEKNACAGDSGGPIKIDGKLAGIASLGSTTCNDGRHIPTLFTSVHHHLEWLEQQMKRNSEGNNEKINAPNPSPANPEPNPADPEPNPAVGSGGSIRDVATNVVDFLIDLLEKH